MNRKSLVLGCCTFAIAACNSISEPGNKGSADSLRALPRAVTSTEQRGIEAGNAFALRLLRETSARTSGKNVLLSPFSVWTALGLTMNGAAGNTESGMRSTLGWSAPTRNEINTAYRDLSALLPTLDPSVTFKSANGIWTRQPMVANASFVSDATDYFNATVSSAATPQDMFDAVNIWANAKTDGLVPKALDGAPPVDLVMMLANALVFKGSWRDRFDVSKTVHGPFTLESGATVSMPLMNRKGDIRAGNSGNAIAVDLPFGNTAYSMLFLVPNSGSVSDYVAQLDSTKLAQALQSLTTQVGANVVVPRFRVTGSTSLRAPLESMGMATAFSDAAEFPRLLNSASNLKLGFVQHAVTVDVDEVGARAAAVTVIGVVLTSGPPTFVINRPFVFFIRERFTGALLFAGVVRDPRT